MKDTYIVHSTPIDQLIDILEDGYLDPSIITKTLGGDGGIYTNLIYKGISKSLTGIIGLLFCHQMYYKTYTIRGSHPYPA